MNEINEAVNRLYNEWKEKMLKGEFNDQLEKVIDFMKKNNLRKCIVLFKFIYEADINKDGKYYYSAKRHQSWYLGENDLWSIVIDLEKNSIFAIPWTWYGENYKYQGSIWGILATYSHLQEFKVLVINKLELLKHIE